MAASNNPATRKLRMNKDLDSSLLPARKEMIPPSPTSRKRIRVQKTFTDQNKAQKNEERQKNNGIMNLAQSAEKAAESPEALFSRVDHFLLRRFSDDEMFRFRAPDMEQDQSKTKSKVRAKQPEEKSHKQGFPKRCFK